MKNQTLVDSSGMTLCTSDKEASGQVVCTGPCLNFWTPLTISGGAPPTVNGVALTTIKRSDDGKLIHDAGGKIVRVEKGHADPRSPHSWPHINYRTATDKRATIRIEEVVRPYP